MKGVKLILAFALLLFCGQVSATDYFWVSGGSGFWSQTSNWALSSGGSGGAGVPGAADKAIFDASGIGACNMDVPIAVTGIELQAGYPGTVTQGGGITVNVAGSGFVVSNGTFQGSDAAINLGLGSTLTINGGNFVSTSEVLTIEAGYTFTSGTFQHNGGKFKVLRTQTLNGDLNLHDLEISAGGSTTLAFATGTDLIVEGTFNTIGGGVLQLIGATESISILGNLDIAHTSTNTNVGGNVTLRIAGTGSQIFNGGTSLNGGGLSKISIEKPSGDLQLNGFITAKAGWHYLSGNVVPGANATDKVVFFSAQTISGSHALGNVEFMISGQTTWNIEANTALAINGTMEITGASRYVFNGGTVSINGDLLLSNTNGANGSGGGTVFKFAGTSDQTLQGQPTTGAGWLPNVEINKASGTLFLNGNIIPKSSWTYITGNVIQGNNATDLITFYGNKTITGSHALEQVNFEAASNLVIATGTTLTINQQMGLSGGSIIALNTGRIEVGGDILISSTNTINNGGTATVALVGTSDQTITSPATATWSFLPNIEINKTGGDVLLTNDLYVGSNLKMLAGHIQTGAGGKVVFQTAATASDGSGTSYIDGPADKIGGGCFAFPFGSGTNFHPLTISCGSLTDVVTAQYFPTGQTFGSPTATTLSNLSTCEHWTVTRTDPSSVLQIALGWSGNSCNINPNLGLMRVAGWNGLLWEDHGNGGTVGDGTQGGIFSSTTISNWTAFTLAQDANQTPDPNTTSWTGTTSTVWNDASNWTNGVPTAALTAVVGDFNYVGPFQPTISGNQPVTLKGLIVGETGTTIALNIQAKSVKVKGDVIIGTNGTVNMIRVVAPQQKLKVEGAWINSGTFVPGTSIVSFEHAVAPQIITGTTFYNLVLKAQNGFEIFFAGDLTINNKITIKEGNINAGNAMVHVHGTWENKGGTFIPETSTVIMYGLANTDVKMPQETFNNFVVAVSPNNKLFVDATTTLTINGDLTVQSGTLRPGYLNASTGAIVAVGTSNTLHVKDGAFLWVETTNFADKYQNFSTKTMDVQSTVIYGGTVAQNIDNTFNYGNLSVEGNTAKTLVGDVFVAGNLTNRSTTQTGNHIEATTNNYNLEVDGNYALELSELKLRSGIFTLGGNWLSGGLLVTEGKVVFDGANLQNLNQSGLTFHFVEMMGDGGVQLNQPISINKNVRFTEGILHSTSTNTITFNDNTVALGGSDMSFVDGPVNKIGDDPFVFPTGYVDGGGAGYLAPIRISEPSLVTSQVVAEYKKEQQTFGTALEAGLSSVSGCEFWTLESLTQAETVDVFVAWDDARCLVDTPELSTIVNWDGSQWISSNVEDIFWEQKPLGGTSGILKGGGFGLSHVGKIPITTGVSQDFDQGYARLKKRLDGGYYIVDDGKLFFKYDEAYDDQDAQLTYRIYDEQHIIDLSSVDQQLSVFYGDNWQMLDLTCDGTGLNGGHYILEVCNEKKEKVYLRFFQKRNFACSTTFGN